MPSAMKIAIVDDEKDMRQSISQWLALSGYDTEAFASAEDALKKLGPEYPGIVVTDIKMPGMDGMQFLKKLMGADSSLPVIMITGHGDVPMAVEAMRIGAYDFLEKPFNPDRMNELAKKAANARRLTLDNRALRRELSDGGQLMKKLIGASPIMERLKEDILDLGQADGHVLIEGETGTGKTLVAHALHAVGARAGKKFVLVPCSAFEEDALMKRLFRADEPRRYPASGGGRGPRRHAGAGRHRSAVRYRPGAPLDLHERRGHAARNPHRRHLQHAGAGPHLRGRPARRSFLPSGQPAHHRAAAAPARRGYPDALHPLW